MRRLIPLVAVLGLVALPLVARAATTHEVDIRDRAYHPPSTTITTGDTVRWTNRDLENHTVTFTNDTTSEPILPGRGRTTTFETPGTYYYRCDFHPAMQGTVTVRAASPSTTSTTRATTTSTTQDPRGSAITAPPETTTTTTSTTTTTVVEEATTTTTTMPARDESAVGNPGDDSDDVDGPGAVAALLLLATAGGAFLVTRRAFP